MISNIHSRKLLLSIGALGDGSHRHGREVPQPSQSLQDQHGLSATGRWFPAMIFLGVSAKMGFNHQENVWESPK